MPDKNIAAMVQTLTEQNKVMIEIMKTQSDKNETPSPSNFTRRPAEIQQLSSKIKIIPHNR